MATPIVVNPTNPSQVVINSGSGHSGIVVVPSDKETIRLENPKYSGTPILMDDSIDWGRIETIATEAAKEAVVDLIIPIDDKLSTTSENAVQNKVLTNEIESLKEENSRLNDKVVTLGKLAAAGIVL